MKAIEQEKAPNHNIGIHEAIDVWLGMIKVTIFITFAVDGHIPVYVDITTHPYIRMQLQHFAL